MKNIGIYKRFLLHSLGFEVDKDEDNVWRYSILGTNVSLSYNLFKKKSFMKTLRSYWISTKYA